MQSFLVAILFWSMALTACGYAVALGGWEGRWTTAIIVLASFATMASNKVLSVHWYSTNTLMLLVDLATFLAMYVVAAKSRRWWPIWVAAFQLNSVVAHLGTTLSPDFSALVYHGYEGLWAIPGQLIMVYGIYRDRVRNNHYDIA